MSVQLVESDSTKGLFYDVDLGAGVCTCPDFTYRSEGNPDHQCKHLRRAKMENGEPTREIVRAPIMSQAPAPRLSAKDTMILAEQFVASGYFKDLKDVAQAVVKIKAGEELGLGPMASIKGIYINQRSGSPEYHAGIISAIINRGGKYNYTVLQQSGEICVLAWHEAGREVGQSEFTIGEAKKAGLVRSGGAWEHYPSDMLFARALTRGARRFAPDAFLGMPIYTVGETGDDQSRPPQPESVTTKAAETTPVVVEQSYGHSYPVRAAELSYQEQQDEDAKAPSNAYGYYKYLLGMQPEDGPKFQEVGKPTPKHIQALQGNFDQRGIEYAMFNGNLAEEMGK